MKSFEEFKRSRTGMDPEARKYSDSQWEQAYAAYCRARGRRKLKDGEGGGGEESGEAASFASGKGTHAPTHASRLVLLRSRIRSETAYGNLRLIVDILFWIAIIAVGVLSFSGLMLRASVPATVVYLAQSVIWIVTLVALRLLAHVVVDIPDVALYRADRERRARMEGEGGD